MVSKKQPLRSRVHVNYIRLLQSQTGLGAADDYEYEDPGYVYDYEEDEEEDEGSDDDGEKMYLQCA